MAEKKPKETRTKTWTIVLYPESAPANWRDLIDEQHIEWIESPLHDQDYDATGELKKAHWHILLIFGGVKAYEQVRELTDVLNAPSPQRCHNARAMVRYMAHLDNPDKALYEATGIIGHGGADVSEMLKPSSSERYSLIKEMIGFVQANEITEFKDLTDYATEFRFDDWFPLLCDSSTMFISSYIRSCRHKSEK